MKMIKTNYQFKQNKQKELSRAKQTTFRKEKEQQEFKKMQRQKDLKKKVLKTLSKIEQAKKAKNEGKHRNR
jgi:ribosome biogenesis protein BMS1